MNDHLQFNSRSEFRLWLENNCTTSDGVWLLFGKSGGPATIKASEALLEALCFGWIDGQMKSVDSGRYLKYFARRTPNSKWSDKNKKLAQELEQSGLMSEFGKAKIAEAKLNGQWNKPKAEDVSKEQIVSLANILKEHELAYENFQNMSASIQKTYTRAFFDAKTESGREKRLAWMVERLNKNLKPM